MHTSRIVAGLSVALLAVGLLVGCGGREAKEEPTATVQAQEPTVPPEEPSARPEEEEPTATPEEEPTATLKSEEEPTEAPSEEPTEASPAEQPTATQAAPAPGAAMAGAEILESSCTQCHGLDRVTEAQKSPEEWMVTVTRMIGHGAELSPDQLGALVGFLGGTYGP